jgi:hypothetical protein
MFLLPRTLVLNLLYTLFLAENQLDAPLLIPIVTSHGHQYGLTITEAVLTQFCLS